MKLKKDYILQELMDDFLVIPVGEASREFKGLIRLNATGAFIWNAIRDGADTKVKILREMLEAYEDLDEAVARADLDRFLKTASIALEE